MLTNPLCRPLTSPLCSAITATRSSGRPIDLFVIVGQSNAEGRGSSASSPAAPYGRYISGSTITYPLADPVGGATTGSMWPAFSNEWYVQTGRRSAFVEQATGGTALLPDTAGSNWSPSGSLRAAAVSAANSAIAALGGQLGRVYFLWAQGEQDAISINGTTITGALYNTALQALADYFKAQVPSMVTMGVIRTGQEKDNSISAQGYADIRAAQELACATDTANMKLLSTITHSFPALGWESATPHYDQPGLNVLGKVAARQLNNPVSLPLAAPTFLQATSYSDPSYTATNGRTVAHTTHASCQYLIVCAVFQRPEDSTTFTTQATFDGVAMNKVSGKSVKGTVASLSTPTVGRTDSAIYVMDVATYGASLGGITKNIAVSAVAGNTGNLIDWVVLELSDDAIVDSIYAYNPTPAASAAGACPMTTGGPAFIAICGSSIATDSGAALTCTPTNFTEVLDHGLGNATTRSGQCCIGYTTESAAVTLKDYTCTWSASCNGIAIAGVAFRKKMSGE